MDLKEIASISGKPGLFRVLKPTRNGVIIESIDDKKVKQVVNANYRVSLLQEISIYTFDAEGAVPLAHVYKTMFEKFGKELPINGNASKEELESFVESIIPNYDKDRVYHSDMKKLVNWYATIASNYPEVLENNATNIVEEK